MIFVDSLASIDTTENSYGEEELDYSDGGLKDYRNDSDQTEDTVWGSEMGVVALVYLDDEEGTEETQDTEQLDDIVDAGAQQFLVRSGGRLKDESSLDLQEEGGAGQQLEVGLVKRQQGMQE
jgi:hypothetical protein